jgi:AraC-like DNA-binding protein
MDLQSSSNIKSYTNQGLDYFHVSQASPCLDMIATPLEGDARLDLSIVDFGPLVLVKRRNSSAAIEQYQFSQHVIAIQLPVAQGEIVDRFQSLLGGLSHSPFLPAGAKAHWTIPGDMWMYQLHIDVRWLEKALGTQAMKDYVELSRAASRKAYDKQTLFAAASACEYMFERGIQSCKEGQVLSATQLENMTTDILLPCIMSDIGDDKTTTRQKILGKALDCVHEQFALPLSLETLAQASSTSVRNLQIVFKQELGISPGSYIQQFRLHRFRHFLADASSVTEAAYAAGFKHLGRLTERYARVFKSNPSTHLSQTVRDRFHLGGLLDMDNLS